LSVKPLSNVSSAKISTLYFPIIVIICNFRFRSTKLTANVLALDVVADFLAEYIQPKRIYA
ncbi:hypothetical protein MW871_16210, partial [Flavobacterium sp. I-SCBP12n]